MNPLVVVCNQCGTEYSFSPSGALSASKSFQFRCTNCGHRFSVSQELLEDDAAEAATASPTAMLLRQGSDVYRINGMATLKRWIFQQRVDQDDRLSTGDDRWERLGDIPVLADAFDDANINQFGSVSLDDEPPTESLHDASPRSAPLSAIPSEPLMEIEDPTEDISVDTTWDDAMSSQRTLESFPDPSLLDTAPIPPPAEQEPAHSEEDRFLSDDAFFSEPMAVLRSTDDELSADWQDEPSSSNTWIIVGVVVAAILLLLLVEPWAANEPVDSPPEDPASATSPSLVPAAAEPSAAEPSAAEPSAAEPSAAEPEEPVAPAEEPVAPAEEPVAPADEPVAEPAPKPVSAPSAQSLSSAGWLAVESQQFSKARDLFTQSLAERPGSADSRYGLGYALDKLGDADAAFGHYCRALKGGADVDTQREVEGQLRAMGRQCD
ncbi:MAG: hypothetical protein P8R54_04660 [Myxococcota bacterium]|nr:hypothetical protein [Myxococcota bacterium]